MKKFGIIALKKIKKMARIDKQKEKITFWRMLFFFWLTLIVGLISYIFNNLENLNSVKMIFSNIALISVIFLLILTSIKLKKETDKLEDM